MLGDAARFWRLIFSKACLKTERMELSKNIIPLNIISSTKQPPNSFSWWDDPTLWVHQTFFPQATPANDSFYCFPQVGFLFHSISSCWKALSLARLTSVPHHSPRAGAVHGIPQHQHTKNVTQTGPATSQINAGHCTQVSAKLMETFQGSSLLSGVTTELSQNQPSAQ